MRKDLRLFAASDVGRVRGHNEDSFLVDSELGLAIVADGMGGHAAGEVASAMAVETTHAELLRHRESLSGQVGASADAVASDEQVLGWVAAAIQKASARIHALAESDPSKHGMGTTLSMLLALDGSAYVAHVGDCRIYLARDGVLRRLTRDHTLMAELGRLGLASGDNLDGIPLPNSITRAVGLHPDVEVDTFTIELAPGDQLLLATDGLTRYLERDDELLAPLAEQDGELAAHSLIDLANSRGGKDNITVVLLRVAPSTANDALRASRLSGRGSVIRKLPLFCRLEERELRVVMAFAQVDEVPPGQVVLREGEPSDRMSVVLSGQLAVSSGPTLLAELGPGKHVGEMALFRSSPHPATVAATTHSELLSLRRDDWLELVRAEPAVAVKLVSELYLRLADWLDRTAPGHGIVLEALLAGKAPAGNAVPAPAARSSPPGGARDPLAAPPPGTFGLAGLGPSPAFPAPPAAGDEQVDDLKTTRRVEEPDLGETSQTRPKGARAAAKDKPQSFRAELDELRQQYQTHLRESRRPGPRRK